MGGVASVMELLELEIEKLLGFGPAGLVPGVEDVLHWTRISIAGVAALVP